MRWHWKTCHVAFKSKDKWQIRHQKNINKDVNNFKHNAKKDNLYQTYNTIVILRNDSQ